MINKLTIFKVRINKINHFNQTNLSIFSNKILSFKMNNKFSKIFLNKTIIQQENRINYRL